MATFQTEPVYAAGSGEYRFDLTVARGARGDWPESVETQTIADMNVVAKDDLNVRLLNWIGGAIVVLLGVLVTRLVTARQAPITVPAPVVNIVAPSVSSQPSLRQRSLTDGQVNALVSSLSRYQGQQLTLSALANDAESNKLAAQIFQALVKAGWNVSGVNAAIMPGIPVTGIQVSVSGQPGQPVPEPMNTLMTILRQAGLAVVAVAAGPQEVPSVLVGTAG